MCRESIKWISEVIMNEDDRLTDGRKRGAENARVENAGEIIGGKP